MASKFLSERKSCRSLTLNQKLEMIKLSKEGKSKAEIRPKARPLGPVSQSVNAKEKFLKEKCYISEHMNDEKVKQPNR